MPIDSHHDIYLSGYTMEPHRLLHEICTAGLNCSQMKVLLELSYFTLGWGEIERHVANKEIARMTGLRSNHVARAISQLVKRKIIFVGTGHYHTMGINFNYGQWQRKEDKAAKPKKTKPIAKKEVSSKMETTDKPEPKTARKVTPEWFKEFWKIYPVHRRGGNHSFGWKKWQTLGLAEDDASKAKEWLLSAAKVDTAWAHDATCGYAVGLARFMNESHWLTPVPTPMPKDDGVKIEHVSDKVKKFNAETVALMAASKRAERGLTFEEINELKVANKKREVERQKKRKSEGKGIIN